MNLIINHVFDQLIWNNFLIKSNDSTIFSNTLFLDSLNIPYNLYLILSNSTAEKFITGPYVNLDGIEFNKDIDSNDNDNTYNDDDTGNDTAAEAVVIQIFTDKREERLDVTDIVNVDVDVDGVLAATGATLYILTCMGRRPLNYQLITYRYSTV
mgnify:CR=1 FL=1